MKIMVQIEEGDALNGRKEPRTVILPDGRQYAIKKVLHSAVPTKTAMKEFATR